MEGDDYKLKYKNLCKKVLDMLNTQQLYFKSNKDFELLKKSKGMEKEIREIITPKPTQQKSLFTEEFLAK